MAMIWQICLTFTFTRPYFVQNTQHLFNLFSTVCIYIFASPLLEYLPRASHNVNPSSRQQQLSQIFRFRCQIFRNISFISNTLLIWSPATMFYDFWHLDDIISRKSTWSFSWAIMFVHGELPLRVNKNSPPAYTSLGRTLFNRYIFLHHYHYCNHDSFQV